MPGMLMATNSGRNAATRAPRNDTGAMISGGCPSTRAAARGFSRRRAASRSHGAFTRPPRRLRRAAGSPSRRRGRRAEGLLGHPREGRLGHRLVVLDEAVAEVDDAAGVVRDVVLVRDDEERVPAAVELLEQPHDLLARRRVEV